MHTETISFEIYEFSPCIERKSHPRYLSFPGLTAMMLDVQKFRRNIPHGKRPEIRVEKIMQSGWSPG